MHHHLPLRSRRARGVVAGALGVVALAGVALVGPTLSASPGDPAGANGSITIDGAPFDARPDNEPHVGCLFEVDFAGFDEGDHVAVVDFAVQPPTGPRTSILTDEVPVGEDAAGGATDLDAERSYDLAAALAGLAPHPEQGHHLKVTVDAPGRGGKIATKHKVFWVEGCDAPVPCELTPQGCGGGNPE
jgi:hypothetical protein